MVSWWWFLGGDEPRLRFSKFRPQNPFLGKFGPEKSKLSVLSKNEQTWYLKDADSFSNISFLNFQPKNSFLGKFGPKKSKLSVLSENWNTWYLMEADSYSDIFFLNLQPKTENLGQKSQICPFHLKIGTHGISRMLILIPKLAFWISKPKSIFGQS